MQFELRFRTDNLLTDDWIRGIGTDDIDIIKEELETEDLLLSLIDCKQGVQDNKGFVMYLNLEEAKKIPEFAESNYINVEIRKDEGKLSKIYLERVIGVSYSDLDKSIFRVRIFVRINHHAIMDEWLAAGCPKILHLDGYSEEECFGEIKIITDGITDD